MRTIVILLAIGSLLGCKNDKNSSVPASTKQFTPAANSKTMDEVLTPNNADDFAPRILVKKFEFQDKDIIFGLPFMDREGKLKLTTHESKDGYDDLGRYGDTQLVTLSLNEKLTVISKVRLPFSANMSLPNRDDHSLADKMLLISPTSDKLAFYDFDGSNQTTIKFNNRRNSNSWRIGQYVLSTTERPLIGFDFERPKQVVALNSHGELMRTIDFDTFLRDQTPVKELNGNLFWLSQIAEYTKHGFQKPKISCLNILTLDGQFRSWTLDTFLNIDNPDIGLRAVAIHKTEMGKIILIVEKEQYDNSGYKGKSEIYLISIDVNKYTPSDLAKIFSKRYDPEASDAISVVPLAPEYGHLAASFNVNDDYSKIVDLGSTLLLFNTLPSDYYSDLKVIKTAIVDLRERSLVSTNFPNTGIVSCPMKTRNGATVIINGELYILDKTGRSINSPTFISYAHRLIVGAVEMLNGNIATLDSYGRVTILNGSNGKHIVKVELNRSLRRGAFRFNDENHSSIYPFNFDNSTIAIMTDDYVLHFVSEDGNHIEYKLNTDGVHHAAVPILIDPGQMIVGHGNKLYQFSNLVGQIESNR